MSPEQELTTLNPGPLAELLEVDLNFIGVPVIIRFCNSRVNGILRLDGEIYTPWPIELAKFGSNSDGPLPAPTVTLSNSEGVISSLLDIYQPRGALFRRRLILRKHLDDGADPRTAAQFRPDEFFINTWQESQSTVVIQLKTALESLNTQVPARRIINLRSGE